MDRREHLKSLLGIALIAMPKGSSSTFILTGPTSVDISPGKAVQVTISVIKGKGKPRRVYLTTVTPLGLTITLTPNNGIPTFNSLLTITASPNLPVGDYSLEIIGQLA